MDEEPRLTAWAERLRELFPDGAAPGWLYSLALAAAATVLWVVLWRLLGVLQRRLDARVRGWQGTRIRGIRFQSQELFSAEEVTGAVAGGVKGAELLARLLLTVAWLDVVLGVFPATQGLSARMHASVAGVVAEAFWSLVHYLPNLLWIAFIVFLARLAVHLARLFFRGVTLGRIRLPGLYPEFGKPTFEMVRIVVVVLAAAMMFPYLPGQESPAFRAIGLFVGVLVSLGSTGAIANIISGILLTYTRAFRVGDRVRIADALGDVVEKTTFATRVRTPKNVEIVIPNAMVLSNHIINFSAQAAERGLILHTAVTIGYDVPWARVHELMLAAARATDGVEAEPAPFVLQLRLDDAYVHYELNATTRRAGDMQRIYSDLHRHILDRFHEAGVEIASPAFLALRDGNAANIPEDYLPRDYQPPRFRIGPVEWKGG